MPEIPSKISDGVYAAAALAMVPLDSDDEETELFEWHHCIDQPNCRGATEPCACSGMPWPSPVVRAAVESAYRAGREDESRDALIIRGDLDITTAVAALDRAESEGGDLGRAAGDLLRRIPTWMGSDGHYRPAGPGQLGEDQDTPEGRT